MIYGPAVDNEDTGFRVSIFVHFVDNKAYHIISSEYYYCSGCL